MVASIILTALQVILGLIDWARKRTEEAHSRVKNRAMSKKKGG